MNRNIFEISELKCSYYRDWNKPVLRVDNLSIQMGEIVFFVGASGIGKSTILETLGLMNNTIASVKKFEYDGMDLSSAWKWNDKRLSDFRKSEYSFIFQENNLMPNFSAYENVMITAMFQGMSKDVARKSAETIIDEIMKEDTRWPVKEKIEKRSISSFSGGQRQRLAFARAILPNFSVLFGDEPTGNLDSGSAERLMNILTAKLRDKNKKILTAKLPDKLLTAIIVSHDLKLACEYADMIVKIRKSDNGEYGIIDDASCYKRGESGDWNCGNLTLSVEDLLTKLKDS